MLCESPNLILDDKYETLINTEPIEPTNIQWENFDFDNSTRNKRFFIIIGTILFVLFVTFQITLRAASTQKELNLGKYDSTADCYQLEKIYSK